MLNIKNKFLTFSLFVIIAFAVIFNVFHQNQSGMVEAQSQTPKLTLQIASEDDNYLQLEPIPLRFKLSNQASFPIGLRGLLAVGQDTDLLIRNEGGQEIRLNSFFIQGGLSNFVTIQPNEFVETVDLLEGKRLERIFPYPGLYQIRVEFSYDKSTDGKEREKISSNPIVIEIREPHGINKQAYDFIKGKIEPVQFKIHPRELGDIHQHFVNAFGNSVYAKYAGVKLAGIYRVFGEDTKAERELCKIHDLKFYHSQQVKKSLSEINAKLRPIDLKSDMPTDGILLIKHPCTGKPVDPYAF